MQHGHGWVDRPLRQERVVERNAEVLAVQRKAKLPLLHIEEDSNCALFLIFVAVGGALRVIPVPQLAQAVVGEASVRVAERRIEINVIGDADANFHLVFSHRMQLHLPVVQTFLERLVYDCRFEDIGGLIQGGSHV